MPYCDILFYISNFENRGLGLKMNKREKINLNKWERAELFREFIGMTTSIYDMTVRMDVTNLVNY